MRIRVLYTVAALAVCFCGMTASESYAGIGFKNNGLIAAHPMSSEEALELKEQHEAMTKALTELASDTLLTEGMQITRRDMDYIEAELVGVSPEKDQELLNFYKQQLDSIKAEDMRYAYSNYRDPSMIFYALGHIVYDKGQQWGMVLQVNKVEAENKYLIEISSNARVPYSDIVMPPTDPVTLMNYVQSSFTSETVKVVDSRIGYLKLSFPAGEQAIQKAAKYCQTAMDQAAEVVDCEVNYSYIREDGSLMPDPPGGDGEYRYFGVDGVLKYDGEARRIRAEVNRSDSDGSVSILIGYDLGTPDISRRELTKHFTNDFLTVDPINFFLSIFQLRCNADDRDASVAHIDAAFQALGAEKVGDRVYYYTPYKREITYTEVLDYDGTISFDIWY